MILKSLSLRNFRSFESLDIAFHDRLAVIVGNNGAGKTAILESAVVAVGTLLTAMDGLPKTTIKKTDATLKAFTIGQTDDVQPQFPVSIEATGVIDGREVTWRRDLNGLNGNTTIKDAKSITSIAGEYQKRLRAGDTSLVLPIIAYYGTGRLWDNHRAKKSDTFKANTRINGYIDSLDGTANIKLMMNWFRKQTIQRYQRQEAGLEVSPELETVCKAMESCFHSVTGFSDVHMQYNLNTNEIDVRYTDAAGCRMSIPLDRLSDGYKGTISLIADIAYRMAVLNPQLLSSILTDTPGIVFIDEVDLHLHPTWQQRVLNDLTSIFPNVQFVVSTHAIAVVNSAKSENLIVLEDGNAFSPLEQVYGKDANTVLNTVMRASVRPPEVSLLFQQFYAAIDEEKYSEAESVLLQLEQLIGNNDAEMVSCRITLDLAQI